MFKSLKVHKPKMTGFTMVEVVVAIFILSLVALLFGNTMVGALGIQRRAFSIQQVQENASFILEAMAKEIRVSQVVGADSDCPTTPANTLVIDHPINGQITYTRVGNNVHRMVDVGGVVTDTVFNSATVQFTRLQFCIVGANFSDQKQPRVVILANVQSANVAQQTAMDVQTTVSIRYLSN